MPDHVELLAAVSSAPPLAPLLHGLALFWQALHCRAEAAALIGVARDAIDLFTSGQRHQIRECASSHHGALSVDSSCRRWVLQ